MAFTYKYRRPALTVDTVVFGVSYEEKRLDVLLIKRKNAPFKGKWALPGGFVDKKDDDLHYAALRELKEEAGIMPDHIEQLGTYGAKGRDPRERVVSVAYFSLLNRHKYFATAGSDAAETCWMPARQLPSIRLAFDHNKIVADAINRLEGKVRYTPIGLWLIEPFTIGDIRKLYEIILGRPMDVSNFRRKFAKYKKFLKPHGSKYLFDWDQYKKTEEPFEI